jgi:hypothetical protein
MSIVHHCSWWIFRRLQLTDPPRTIASSQPAFAPSWRFLSSTQWDLEILLRNIRYIQQYHAFMNLYIYMRACIYKKMNIFKNKPKLFRLWACLRLARPGPQMLTYTTSSLTPSSAKLGPDERAVDVISTLWLFNVAMENSPFIDDLWWLTYQTWWFSMATLNN